MSDPLPPVEAGIYAALTGNPDVAALVGGKVYYAMAPAGLARPYLLFYLASGMLERRTARLDTNDVYRIEAVADTLSRARELRDAALRALDGGQLGGNGFANIWTAAEGAAVLTELRNNQVVWRFIVEVRIRTSKE